MEFLKHIKSSFSRRKFFVAGTIALSGFGLLRIFFTKRKVIQQTAKFLSQDGKLVEVQLKHVPRKKFQATKEDIMKWVWKNI